jgi:hypothetical protein
MITREIKWSFYLGDGSSDGVILGGDEGAELFVCPLLTIKDDTGLSSFEEGNLCFESRQLLFESRLY